MGLGQSVALMMVKKYVKFHKASLSNKKAIGKVKFLSHRHRQLRDDNSSTFCPKAIKLTSPIWHRFKVTIKCCKQECS